MHPSGRLELIGAPVFPTLTWLPWYDPYVLPGMVAQVTHISSYCEAEMGGFLFFSAGDVEVVVILKDSLKGAENAT